MRAPLQQEPQAAEASAGDQDNPSIDLGFDPRARAALPFELTGQGEPESDNNVAATASDVGPARSSEDAFLRGPQTPVSAHSATIASLAPDAGDLVTPTLPSAIAPAASPSATAADDFLSGPAVTLEEPTDAPPPPKLLHISCPSGHLVKAPSNLLGQLGRCPACKETFELRYENSIEFQRRTQNILRQDENEEGREWVAWAFLGAFLVFVGLVGVVLMLGR
jgi:hypothetical protein